MTATTAHGQGPLERLAQLFAHEGKDRAFLASEPIRNVVRKGIGGFEITVRLTSYRALTLSCIVGFIISVDGTAFDPSTFTLFLNGADYKIADLGALTSVWWFVLDTATVFVPRDGGLAPGEHEIDATLVTVEPYMTAGRFQLYSPSKKRLSVEA
jgi:hypothetical protein